MPLLHRHLPQNLALLFGAHAPTAPSRPLLAHSLFLSRPPSPAAAYYSRRYAYRNLPFGSERRRSARLAIRRSERRGLSSAVSTDATADARVAPERGEYGFLARLMRGFARTIHALDHSRFSRIYFSRVFVFFLLFSFLIIREEERRRNPVDGTLAAHA